MWITQVLGVLFVVFPFVVAILFALGLSLLIWAFYFKPNVGLWAVMSVFAWEAMAIYLPGLNLGVYLYPTDIVFGALAFSGGLRLLQRGHPRRIPKSLALLGASMAISFVVGVAKFGSVAGVEFRGDFYFLIGAFYFASVPVTRESLNSFVKVWLWWSIIVLTVVYYRWAADAFNLDWFDPVWHTVDKSVVAFRVVDAAQALVLGQTLVLLVYAMTTDGGLRYWRWMVPFLAITVLVLQHRSVWVSVLLPILLAFVIAGKARGKIALNLAAFGVAVAFVVAPMLAGGGLSSVTSSVSSSAERGANLNEGTFAGRVTGWQELLVDWTHSGPVVYAMGKPYGSGFTRIESESTGREVQYAPHNYFVQTLLRTGLIGLFALVTTYVLALRWLGRAGGWAHSDVPVSAIIALLIGQLLYFIPYSPHYEQGIILGMALSLVRDRVTGWRSPALEGVTQ